MGLLTTKQKNKLKSPIADADQRLTQTHQAFAPITPGPRITDLFPSQFSFHSSPSSKPEDKKQHITNLKNAFLFSQSSISNTCIVADGGVKKEAATAVAHTWSSNSIIDRKTLHATNVTSIKAEVMAIRLGLDNALEKEQINHITVTTDCIQAAKAFFDPKPNPFQSLTKATTKRIHNFFSSSPDKRIVIWHCPSGTKWRPHHNVDKDIKSSHIAPTLLSKETWAFNKKSEYDDIINYWARAYEATDRKGKSFLDLTDNKGNILIPSHIKGGPWLMYIGQSNSLCACLTRLITNRAPIGEYRKRFFPQKENICDCGLDVVETRDHILYECNKYSVAWRPPDLCIVGFLTFLENNPATFCFTT